MIQKCSQWKVLRIFFLEPTRIHYIKEIARKIGLAHTSVKKHLLEIANEGLIKKTKGEIFSGYKADRENPEFIFYKKINNLIELKKSGIIEIIKERYPKSIILFGSYEKGEDIETSDIDLFIDSKKFDIETEKLEKSLNRGIHIIFKGEESKSLSEGILQGTLLFGER